MNGRKIVLLIVAFIIAGGTALMARSMLKANQTPTTVAQGEAPKAPVVASVTEILVAAKDLPTGTLIKEGDLKWQPWPTDAATDAYMVKGKADKNVYIGSLVRQGLRINEPVIASRVVKTSEQGFLAAVLTAGMRALTIPVTPASSIAGLIYPGDKVDVIVTHKLSRRSSDGNGAAEHKVSETVLTNVRVLALDQRTNDQVKEGAKDVPKPPQLATLEVSPREAERLALVSEMGTISLSLRSLASDEPTHDALDIKLPGKNTDPSNLTWDSDVSRVTPEPVNRRGQVSRVQVMRGKETTESVFDAP